MKIPLFHSKILLFGEYGIVQNSKGLCIPYDFYKGVLTKENICESALESNEDLLKYHGYLLALPDHKKRLVDLDLDAFALDIYEGMHFDSSIPKGYGIGSSGALVAAVYDKYSRSKISSKVHLSKGELDSLRCVFSVMEDYFHGASSGFDPLNSYLSLPMLINSKKQLKFIGLPPSKHGKGAVFLIDSEITSETAPMVRVFMKKMEQKSFRQMLQKEFIIHTENCIEAFLKGNFSHLFSHMKELSEVILDHFKPMIPEKFHELWQQGIDTGKYYLKLCGSGGGGYILGFTEDLDSAKHLLKDYKIQVVHNL